MRRFLRQMFCTALLCLGCAPAAQAVVLASATETGGGVSFKLTGSYDITTWTLFAEASPSSPTHRGSTLRAPIC
jgi:hypothetical protein